MRQLRWKRKYPVHPAKLNGQPDDRSRSVIHARSARSTGARCKQQGRQHRVCCADQCVLPVATNSDGINQHRKERHQRRHNRASLSECTLHGAKHLRHGQEKFKSKKGGRHSQRNRESRSGISKADSSKCRQQDDHRPDRHCDRQTHLPRSRLRRHVRGFYWSVHAFREKLALRFSLGDSVARFN